MAALVSNLAPRRLLACDAYITGLRVTLDKSICRINNCECSHKKRQPSQEGIRLNVFKRNSPPQKKTSRWKEIVPMGIVGAAGGACSSLAESGVY